MTFHRLTDKLAICPAASGGSSGKTRCFTIAKILPDTGDDSVKGFEGLKLIRPKTKCDLVTEQILNMILNGSYKMGTKLPPENALCEQFGVSRITIRESLKRLGSMGIVTIQQGKGTYVNLADMGFLMKPMLQLIDFNEIDVSTIYDARLPIEEGICVLAAQNRDDNDIEALRRLLSEMAQSFETGDGLSLRSQDSFFHVALADASKNQLLKATILTIEDISAACARRHNLLNTTMTSAQLHHKAILDAIVCRDGKAAATAMREHTLEAKALLLAAMSKPSA